MFETPQNSGGRDPLVGQIADAVLYEGYLLYPYRRSALKNRVRWLFGRVLPEDYRAAGGAEGPVVGTECLVLDSGGARLSVEARFLHLCRAADEATGRSVVCDAPIAELLVQPRTVAFEFPEAGPAAGEHRTIRGVLQLSVAAVSQGAFRCAVQVRNRTPLADDEATSEPAALEAAFVSTHVLLRVANGEFVSLLDPPDPLRGAAAACRQERLWPVLVGASESRQAMLAAPIILEDYPRVAPESAGDLFDGTEIDELLTLRVRTLSDAEKQEIRAGAGPAATLLERSEALADEQLRRLHGTLRSPAADAAVPPANPLATDLAPGDRVRVRPRAGADAFDRFLAGKTARVESIECDFDDRVHVAVTIDDDPGRDLGAQGWPGHRFYFHPDELERLDGNVGPACRAGPVAQPTLHVEPAPPGRRDLRRPRILVACIGNVFFGDDGFGVEVARRLHECPPAPGVDVVDFGIRGVDLAYALTTGYDAVVIVDALSRGGSPGTLSVLELEPEALDEMRPAGTVLEAHSLDPLHVLHWVRESGEPLPPIRIIGCEPAHLGTEDAPQMGLSAPVHAAVDEGLRLVEETVAELRRNYA